MLPCMLPDAVLPRRPTRACCSLRRSGLSKAPDCRGASAAQPSRASCSCLLRELGRLEGKPLLGRREIRLGPVAEVEGALDQGVLLLPSTMLGTCPRCSQRHGDGWWSRVLPAGALPLSGLVKLSRCWSVYARDKVEVKASVDVVPWLLVSLAHWRLGHSW